MKILSTLTARGWTLLLFGVVGAVASMAFGQRDTLWLALALVLLPIAAIIAVARTGLRLQIDRRIEPPQGRLGERLHGHLRITNKGSFPLAVLKFEESLPRELGRRPRFTVHTARPRWTRELSYPMVGQARGRHVVGPMLVRATDPFGLARVDRRFTATADVIVTPRVVPLSMIAASPGAGQSGESTPMRIGLVGQDDVMVREYRDGDDVRRIHWRSTARRGEIMVRREEQSWDPSLTLLLDSRVQAHAGSGPESSFEWAVSAVASIAMHMQEADFTIDLLDAAGPLTETRGMDPANAENALLLALTDAALTPNDPDLRIATEAVNIGTTGEMLIAVMGRLTRPDVAALATMRARRSQGLALVLDVDSFTARRFRASAAQIDEHEECVAALADANWRVVPVRSGTDVDEAWAHFGEIGADS